MDSTEKPIQSVLRLGRSMSVLRQALTLAWVEPMKVRSVRDCVLRRSSGKPGEKPPYQSRIQANPLYHELGIYQKPRTYSGSYDALET